MQSTDANSARVLTAGSAGMSQPIELPYWSMPRSSAAAIQPSSSGSVSGQPSSASRSAGGSPIAGASPSEPSTASTLLRQSSTADAQAARSAPAAPATLDTPMKRHTTSSEL